MTAPGVSPPQAPGWWVRRSQAAFPAGATLLLSGLLAQPRIGTVLRPGGASAALTGSATIPRIGSTLTPGGASTTLTGAAASVIVTVLAHYSDDFNRANSTTSLGTSWTNRSNTMGIDTNGAYPVTSSVTAYATYNSPVLSDNMQVSITIGTNNLSGSSNHGVLGCNTAGEGVRMLVPLTGNNATIGSLSGWTSTTQATSSATVAVTAGDVFTLKRVGNVYTGYKNGVAVGGLTWTDSGNLVPRDSSHRLVGVGAANGAGSYRRVDAWAADDV